MKVLEWQKFLAEQQAQHRKMVFSVAELANAAHTTPHRLNTELGRLVRRGIITRYAQGCYGAPQGVRPEDLLSSLDPGAYITGFYALFRHHLVTQVPLEVTCFTNRRHNRKAGRLTPAGRLRFIRVPEPINSKPASQALAKPEQALCDFVWLQLRAGVEPQSLVTFRKLETLNRPRLKKLLAKYPEEVRRAVEEIHESR